MGHNFPLRYFTLQFVVFVMANSAIARGRKWFLFHTEIRRKNAWFVTTTDELMFSQKYYSAGRCYREV